MTGGAEVLGRVARGAIGLLHARVDGVDRDKIGGMNRVGRADLSGMTARTLGLLMARHAVFAVGQRDRAVSLHPIHRMAVWLGARTSPCLNWIGGGLNLRGHVGRMAS